MLRRLFQRLLALAGLVALSAAAADRLDLGSDSFRVNRWTTDDGLPQNRCSCLQQTRDGYLWIGTWFGLVRFDGLRFTVFSKSNTPELTSDSINALAEDNGGTLWIGTSDGLVSYRQHRFHRITTAEGLPDMNVWRLAGAGSGGLWVQAGTEVMILENGKFSPGWDLKSRERPQVLSFALGADGSLNILTRTSWLQLSPKADELRTNYHAAPFSLLSFLPSNQSHNAWVGTEHGLRRLEEGVLKSATAEELSREAVVFLYQDGGGALWAGVSPKGLFCRTGGRWRAVDLGNGFTPGSIVAMTEDREGNLWLGTEEGLFELLPQRVRAYTARDGLAADYVWSVCEGTDGVIWVGTDLGLSRIRAGHVLALDFPELGANHPDRCVWPDEKGGVWIANQAVVLFQSHGIDSYVHQDTSASIDALYGDREDRLWAGTGDGLLIYQNGERTNLFTNADAHSLSNTCCILEDRAEAMWLGTKGQGLKKLSHGLLSVFTKRDGLSDNNVWTIHEDAEGALWLGTANGLSRYFQGRFFSFTPQQGVPEPTVNCILEDDFGYLWLSGLRGIYRIKRSQLNDVADGRANTVECAIVGTAEGMESSETNGEHQPAGWKARDGRLWFATVKGVVVIGPKKVGISESSIPVVIEQVKADSEVIFGDLVGADERRLPFTKNVNPDPPAPIRLAPGRARVVEFHYTANTFVDSKRSRFRYRLVGYDPDWRETTVERVAHYTNLRPGNYRFEVAAAGHNGVWSPIPESISFSLAPHYWQTWPFYLVCAGFAFALVAGVQAYRLRWQHRLLKLEEQRALAGERARIARDLHDDLGTALTGLALELDVIGREHRARPPVTAQLDQAAQRARELAERMREVVWTVNPSCDTVSSLAGFLEQQVGQFLQIAGVRVRLEFPEDIPAIPLGAEARHQLALAAREALTNIVRHARATEAVLNLGLDGETLTVRISDNGCGFEPVERTGHGLANLRARLGQIGGRFECVSTPGSGTRISFVLPLKSPGPDRQEAG